MPKAAAPRRTPRRQWRASSRERRRAMTNLAQRAKPAFLTRAAHRGPESAKLVLRSTSYADSKGTPMLTQCSPTEMEFGRAGGRRVVADFDGGLVSSDAGALLLGETDKAIGLIDRFTACFGDHRSPLFSVHALKALVGQRVFGLALGYEDLNDHDDLRRDPVLGVLLGKLERDGDEPSPLAGRGRAITRSSTTARRSSGCSSICSSTRTPTRRVRSCSTSTRPTIRCTAIRRGGSFTAITTAIATCRFMSSAAAIFWPPSCGLRTSTAARGRKMRWRALSSKSARAGRG